MEPVLLCSSFYKTDSKVCGNIRVNQTFIEQFVQNGRTGKKVKILITLDISGSMGHDLTNSFGKPKLNVITDSLLEVLEYLFALAENGHEIYLTLLVFSDDTDTVFEEQLNAASKSKIISSIKSLKPTNGTNILTAIRTSKEHLDKMASEDSTIFAIFITDGMNSQLDDNPLIVDEIKTCVHKNVFVGVGIGKVGDDYDGELLNSMFEEDFSGCPTLEEMTNVVIDHVFSASSSLLESVSFDFSEEIKEKYTIDILLFKNSEEKYVLSKLTIATKIPVVLRLKESFSHTDQINLLIKGVNNDSSQFETTLNLLDKVEESEEECAIYSEYFKFQKVYENFEGLETESYKLAVKTLLANVKKQYSTIPDTHAMHSVYKIFVNKLTALDSELGSIHMQNLTDDEFQSFLQFGNMRMFSQSSCARQVSSSSRDYTREISKMVQNTENIESQQVVDSVKQTIDEEEEDSLLKSLPPMPPPLLKTIPRLTRQISCGTTYQDQTQLNTLSALSTKPNLRRLSAPSMSTVSNEYVICLACCENKVSVVCYPCKHANLCTDCIKLTENKCPTCRGNIEFIAEVSIGRDRCIVPTCVEYSNVVNLPCRHVTKCEKCCISDGVCQTCDTPIAKKVKIFKSGL